MSLKAKIISLTDERATLELEDGQTMTVPKTAIEGLAKQGMDVGIVIVLPGAEDAGRQALSRDLLNSLLST